MQVAVLQHLQMHSSPQRMATAGATATGGAPTGGPSLRDAMRDRPDRLPRARQSPFLLWVRGSRGRYRRGQTQGSSSGQGVPRGCRHTSFLSSAGGRRMQAQMKGHGAGAGLMSRPLAYRSTQAPWARTGKEGASAGGFG